MLSSAKVICTFALLAASASSVSAHGKLTNPEGLNVQVNQGIPLTSQKDVTRVRSAGDPACGKFANGRGQALDLASADMSPRMLVNPGTTAQLTWFQQNADGAGPLTASIDTTGTGKNWQPLQLSQNIPGVGGFGIRNSRKNIQLDVQIPQNLQCNGPEGSCLLRLENPLGFVSCAPIGIQSQQQPQQLQQANKANKANKQ
ncbi:hypothetical protein HK102_012527 [Quaeritorhiza haematococci]|nr:hypothetical protein HK102_012527 [Quaeritorhiza haematococci]